MPKKVILCVDDEKIILDSLKSQLKKRFGSKYTYEVAENADEAFEVIEDILEDGLEVLVIVSDWLMPGMKGDELLARVHDMFPSIVKVMLTGQADEEAVENAKKNADLHRCLYKPWTEEELVDTIRSGLEKV
ncbi:response regulator [Desulfobacterales bacterium HSG2]|nr:response regulator [Desulfobacterales bacterium HSG2]